MAIDGLNPMKVDGRVKANVNLAEALKVYPVKDLAMRGQFFVDGTAKGTYSKTQMPVVNAAIRLTNGYVKSAQFPAPIENINLSGTVVNTTGQVNDTQINLPQFKMVLEGEPLEGRLSAHNIDKPVFDANVRGTVDLTKITKIFPLEGMTVTGRVDGDIAAKGNMADVEAGRYQNVVASGTVKASNVTYKSKDLPQGVKISSGTATFNNNQIALQSLNGTAGSSDFAAVGHGKQLPGLPVHAGPVAERQPDGELAQFQRERVDGGRGIGQAHGHRRHRPRPRPTACSRFRSTSTWC